MDKKDFLFSIIELRRYDVLIPFICQRCGACCRNFAPQIPADDWPKIVQYLNKPQEEIKRQHKECYMRKFTETPADCIFLDGKHHCMIYPLRPEGCRLYPFTDFGACDRNCPGHGEFHRIVDAFFNSRIYAAMWEPGSYRRKDKLRTVPIREWPKLLRKFMKAQPSNAMVQKFFKINNVPKSLKKEVS